MSSSNINFGCTEEFSELCALSTSGSLTPEEWKRLEEHVAKCADCATLLTEYKNLTSKGMAKVGAHLSGSTDSNTNHDWDHAQARVRLLQSLEDTSSVRAAHLIATEPVGIKALDASLGFLGAYRPLALAAVTVLVFAAALIGRELGVRKVQAHRGVNETLANTEVSRLRLERDEALGQIATLSSKLSTGATTINALKDRADRAERDLEQLRSSKSSVDTALQQSSDRGQEQSSAIAALTQQRDALQQKLHDSEATLQSIRQELNTIQDDRQRILVRSARLESEVDLLSRKLSEKEATSSREEQYLASDRDIRELMGARQLYIADVFDVDSQGKTKTPFGRVFFTKGKSLIFYAFDLDKQPGYREAKAFQAWGRPSPTQSVPVSLGIFYLDSESSRRWALKFDDPKVLDEISSVFVTLEPQGGSKKPTNKPFLLAYLHTAPPNHP